MILLKEQDIEINKLIRLEKITDEHNKYYEIEIRKSEITDIRFAIWIHWGRIGKKGTWKSKYGCLTKTFVARYANQIIRSKLDKGYKFIDPKKSTPEKEEVNQQIARFIAILEENVV